MTSIDVYRMWQKNYGVLSVVMCILTQFFRAYCLLLSILLCFLRK